jgi:hypothetical protein
MIRDRLASSEHREHTWKISMNRCIDMHGRRWIHSLGCKGLHGENVFAGGDVYNL